LGWEVARVLALLTVAVLGITVLLPNLLALAAVAGR
jgi:hypothetical protein